MEINKIVVLKNGEGGTIKGVKTVAWVDKADDFILHPCLIDLALQAAAYMYMDEAKIKPFFPVSIEEVKMFGKTPSSLFVHIRYSLQHKTKDVEKLLKSLGLDNELKRLKEKKIRKGRGKMRSRKYKKKIGPLIVIDKDEGIIKACKNLLGVEVKNVKKVSVEDLAPGTHAGRLTIWSISSLKNLSV